ncbi:MAG: hypothetical protein RMJ83_09885 [Armatimonadota bacterium]|nr:hypothetical protein [Armatimonadota bacterium]
MVCAATALAVGRIKRFLKRSLVPIGVSDDAARQRDADATHALHVASASSPTTALLETLIGKSFPRNIVRLRRSGRYDGVHAVVFSALDDVQARRRGRRRTLLYDSSWEALISR